MALKSQVYFKDSTILWFFFSALLSVSKVHFIHSTNIYETPYVVGSIVGGGIQQGRQTPCLHGIYILGVDSQQLNFKRKLYGTHRIGMVQRFQLKCEECLKLKHDLTGVLRHLQMSKAKNNSYHNQSLALFRKWHKMVRSLGSKLLSVWYRNKSARTYYNHIVIVVILKYSFV